MNKREKVTTFILVLATIASMELWTGVVVGQYKDQYGEREEQYKQEVIKLKSVQQQLNDTIDRLNKENERLKQTKADPSPHTSTLSRGGSFIDTCEYMGKYTVTAYSLSYRECGKHPWDKGYGITSSGTYVQVWHTIAMDPSIPDGTKIYIPYFQSAPNHGIFTKEDSGSAIHGHKIDVYMETVKSCNNFGIKQLDVYKVQ